MRKRVKHRERCKIVKSETTPGMLLKFVFDWTILVRYELYLTLGCHRFYYLAPLPVLDSICLVPTIHDKIKNNALFTGKNLFIIIALRHGSDLV